MASYLAGNLLEGETVRYRASLSLWRYALRLTAGVLLLAASLIVLVTEAFGPHIHHQGIEIASGIGLLLGALLFIGPFFVRRGTELAITDRRVICKTGLLSTSSIEIRFGKIETVRVQQGLLGRILNFGDIEIRGTGSSFEPIENIARPLAFKNALDQAIEAHRPGTG